jgi:hypothetical protein
MKPESSPGMTKKASRVLAVFSLSLFLAVYAMVAIPALHRLAHDGARDARHECAVTLFAHGQVHCASTMVEWRQPAPLVVATESARRVVFAAADVRLLPSRGPPGFFSSVS